MPRGSRRCCSSVRETAAAVLGRVERSPHDLVILPALGQPGRGASDLRATEALLDRPRSERSRVRILNQEPAVPETHWHEWRRLEAGVNLALRRYDAWAVCVYDRRTLDDEMVDDLLRHPPTVGTGRRAPAQRPLPGPGRVHQQAHGRAAGPGGGDPPSAQLLDPSPATARAAVAAFAIHSKLPAAGGREHGARHARSGEQREAARPAAGGPAPVGAARPAHRHRDRLRRRPDQPLRRAPATRPPERRRARSVDQPPARRHDPPPPPRRLHRPHDRDRHVRCPTSTDPAAVLVTVVVGPGSRRPRPRSRPSARPVRRRGRRPPRRSSPSPGGCPGGTGSRGLRCRCSADR